jgi:Leucine-rich repeat (LRR) protein
LLVTLHTLSDLRAGRLTGLNRLNLSEGLTELPREVLALADTLEVLNLSGNALHSLPDWLPELPHLKVLFCSDNQFKRVPEVVGACPQLSMVGFKSNQITEVPASSLPPALR